ncbi:MAG: hypothetical protein U1F11_01415 [Steroidobacteraceae bacterium]
MPKARYLHHGVLARYLRIGLAAFAPLAMAGPGDLVASYGRGGIVSVPAAVTPDPTYALALGHDPGPSITVAPDGSVLLARIDAGGQCHLERLGPNGQGGLVTLAQPTPCIDRLRPETGVGPAGEILYAFAPDDGSLAIQLRNADGTPDLRFGGTGTVSVRPRAGGFVGRCLLQRLDDGDVVVIANRVGTSVQMTYSQLYVIRLNADGTPDAWGSSGIVVLQDFEWGPIDNDAGGLAVDGTGVVLYGSAPYAAYRQAFSRSGDFYPYFPPEFSVDSSQAMLSEFDGTRLALLLTDGAALQYDGPASRLIAGGRVEGPTLRPPAALVNAPATLRAQRFRVLPDGGLIVAARHERTDQGAAQGSMVLAKFLADGNADATFGRDGAARFDLALGDALTAGSISAPFALPRRLSAPRVTTGGERVMIAGWGADQLGVVALQLQAGPAAAGSIGFLARDGRYETAVDANQDANASLRFQVARSGGRSGAVSVAYRTSAAPELSASFVPATGRLEWADGEDSARDITLQLRPPATGVTAAIGTIDLLLEDLTGAAVPGSVRQHVVLTDYSGGTLAFEQRRLTLPSSAEFVFVNVARLASARGAVSATIRVPLEGAKGRVSVEWADGERSTKQVKVPVDPRWSQFDLTIEPGPRTQVGAIGTLQVTVEEPGNPAAPPAGTGGSSGTTTSSAQGGGGGLLDGTLVALLVALGVVRSFGRRRLPVSERS